ncbi:MAG: PAS domain S-box protein [Thermodesulfobacteriota bacterium]
MASGAEGSMGFLPLMGTWASGILVPGTPTQEETLWEGSVVEAGDCLPADVEAGADRALSEEELRLHRERYRVFIEEVADGFYEVDLRGNFTFFNDALCRIFGYARHEIQGQNYRSFMDERNAQFVFENFNRIYRTGQGVTDLTWEIRRKDGELRVLEVSAGLIRDEQGERIGFRGIARDITERHRAEMALRDSEQRAHSQFLASKRAERRYRTLLDFMPDPVAVFNMDNTVSYVNPAFVRVFGWSLEELEGRKLPFVPQERLEETRQGLRRLLREKVIQGFETRRLTKDGGLREVVLGGALFYDEAGEPSGQVVILRDVTEEKRVARINQALFSISMALPRFWRLEERLEFVIKEVKELIGAEGASVILLDEEKGEFYFPAAFYDDPETGRRMTEIRFPADKGVAGEVLRTGKPLLVSDTSQDPHFFKKVDEQAEYETRNMLDVPIRTEDRIIGVLCAVNKKGGMFDERDAELLSAVANTVAFPIENARMAEQLKRSYEEVQSLNRAKDRVIHHLSHELKTPLSVLSASLALMARRSSLEKDPSWKRTLERAQRNLSRLLEIQYQIEDIMRERDFRVEGMLLSLLELCSDELEALAALETGDEKLSERLRRRIEESFGLVSSASMRIQLDAFVEQLVENLRPAFSHREVQVELRLESSQEVLLPPDVLRKIVEGLLRNAVENTPDGGKVEVTVASGPKGPVLEVKDWGVGITPEGQSLIFKGPFTTRDTLCYSSRRPWDFNAGGKGLDLLRMKVFSERYGFTIKMDSRRCIYVPRDQDVCPGQIELCEHCVTAKDCEDSGGTRVTVEFQGM